MTHFDDEQFRRFRRGELTLDELSAAGRHVAECSACRERIDRSVSVSGEYPDIAAELIAYVDGSLDAVTNERMEQHLAICEHCRDDVDDLRRVAKPRRSPPALLWLLPTAAALIIISGLVVMRQWKPAPSATPRVARAAHKLAPDRDRYQRADWNALVRDALASDALARAAVLTDMAMIAGRLRGEPATEAAVVAPSGIVVESARPRFTWPAVTGADYVVAVYDGRREVARSPRLDVTSWTPARGLIRGRTYGWQVEAGDRIIPEPPAAQALFHVLGARELADIEAARAMYPGDHLLLGLLYARAGLVQEGEAELRRVPEAARIVRSVESW